MFFPTLGGRQIQASLQEGDVDLGKRFLVADGSHTPMVSLDLGPRETDTTRESEVPPVVALPLVIAHATLDRLLDPRGLSANMRVPVAYVEPSFPVVFPI